MSNINVAFDLANTETLEVPLDRWGDPLYTVQLDAGTSVLVEGSLQRINRGETPIYDTLEGTISGGAPAELTALSALTPAQSPAKIRGPYEVIRITATGACTGRLMQTAGPQG